MVLLLNFAVLASFLTIASASHYVEPILQQEHLVGVDGQYKYGYKSNVASHDELRGDDGITRGYYSYIDDKGDTQHVSYTAGKDGFKVQATNLPIHVSLEVVDTPEVSAARAAHAAAYLEATNAALQAHNIPAKLEQTFKDYGQFLRQSPDLLNYRRQIPLPQQENAQKTAYRTLELTNLDTPKFGTNLKTTSDFKHDAPPRSKDYGQFLRQSPDLLSYRRQIPLLQEVSNDEIEHFELQSPSFGENSRNEKQFFAGQDQIDLLNSEDLYQ